MDEVSTARVALTVSFRARCIVRKMNLRLARFPLGGQVVEFFLADMSDASCQDLQAFSEVSGGGETECIHGFRKVSRC